MNESEPLSPSPTDRLAVVLDRDGTLIADGPYLSEPGAVRWLAGAIAGLGRLAEAGIERWVVTNQSGVARGLFTASVVDKVHARLDADLARAGVPPIDAWRYCPHHPASGAPPVGQVSCACRKPAPGLVTALAAERHCRVVAVVGDSATDVELACRLGVTPVLVQTGAGAKTLRARPAYREFAVPGFPAAVTRVLDVAR